MSTILNTNGELLQLPVLPDINKYRVAIITAEWNPDITHALRDGAQQTLLKAGMSDENILLLDVPGTVELANGAFNAHNALQHYPHAVIIIGCVIRGDTPHFDYVCDIAAQATAQLNIQFSSPTIFGVLTVNNLEQAQQRAGGSLGNKGSEAAVAALKMIKLQQDLQKIQETV